MTGEKKKFEPSVSFRHHLEQVSVLLSEEITKAVESHRPFNTAHEGYAVILEELDELWDEVKKERSRRDPQMMLNEAVQVAAMAVRFAIDVVLEGDYTL